MSLLSEKILFSAHNLTQIIFLKKVRVYVYIFRTFRIYS